MTIFFLEYDEPLFRPPSEAYSLIFQVTLGCSWNKCAFCEMYTSKKFRLRKNEEIFAEIEKVARYKEDLAEYRRVFLADGDALILPMKRLMPVLEKISKELPLVRRVSSYASPGNILRKSVKELVELQQAGLKLVYLGIESGDNEVLKKVKKGETREGIVEALLKIKEAGIKSSVMILTGLGGKKYSLQHARASAEVLNLTQPEYASLLVLLFPNGPQRFTQSFGGDYEPLSKVDLFREMKVFIEETKLRSTIFRSDHASNYLILKGILDRDKEKFLEQINKALSNPEMDAVRSEWQRGL